MMKFFSLKTLGLTLLCLAVVSTSAWAHSLVWDASSGTVDGYRVCYGTSSSSLSTTLDVGNVTQCPLDSIALTEGTQYYFAVKAYNTAGESGLSNIVSFTPADTTPPIPPGGVSAHAN